MRQISPRTKKYLASLPQVCARIRDPDHVCGGRITWEHAIIYKAQQYDQPWSIVFLCEKAHAVGQYQDAGTMNKEINVGLALNQAHDAELFAISKVEDYQHKKKYLNEKYPFLRYCNKGRRL